jgi:hypothetical protein
MLGLLRDDVFQVKQKTFSTWGSNWPKCIHAHKGESAIVPKKSITHDRQNDAWN